MTNIQDRNTDILRFREQGMTYQEIADGFDISSSRVGQIINKYETEEKRRQQAEKLRELFRSSDDIEKKCGIQGMLTMARATLQKWQAMVSQALKFCRFHLSKE